MTNLYLLKAGLNAIRKHRGEEELDAMDFLKLIKEKAALVDMKQEFLYRAVNEGFSGGEKKRNEILQMALLEPHLGILDETDSGLDIDALRIVAEGVNKLRGADRAIVVVTHYQRLLNPHRPRSCPCSCGGAVHPVRRQGTGAGTGRKGLWLDRGTGRLMRNHA